MKALTPTMFLLLFLLVATSSFAIAMAAKGLGVALGQKTLAWAELTSGEVIAPFPQVLSLAQPYYAITAHAQSGNNSLRELLDCLTSTTADR